MRKTKIALAATTYSLVCLILSFCSIYLAHNIIAAAIFSVYPIACKSIWIIAATFVFLSQKQVWDCAVNTINDLEPLKRKE